MEMNIPITQSAAWQKLQDDLGEKSFLKSTDGYHYLAILKHTPAGNYLYCPYGPCYNNQKGWKAALESLKEIAREHQAIFIRIEPQDPEFKKYAPKNAKKSHDLNPKETWLLDLTGNDEELRQKLPSRLIRYHKNAEKKGIIITASHNPDDIHYLLTLQRNLAKEKGISTFSEQYLKTELKQPFATLYLVKYREETAAEPTETIIAAGLVFDDDITRYNLQGAQSDQGRKLHATGVLTIQLILDAKNSGKQIFDFWGIAPEGAPDTHPWAGFTNFKKTFNGYEQDYAGTYDIILSPTKYKLYQSLRKLGRYLHH